MINLENQKKLIEFIIEARKLGYEDYNIRILLLDKNWPLDEVARAFYEIKLAEDKKLKKKAKSDGKIVYRYKNTLTIHLDSEVMKIIERRAKKNLLTTPEQVEDIVRRSCAKLKNMQIQDNVDDKLLALFSRKAKMKKK